MRFSCGPVESALPPVRGEWDALAAASGNLFLTSTWIDTFVADARKRVRCVLGHDDEDGTLRAGAVIVPLSPVGIASGNAAPSEQWGVLGDDRARAVLWAHLAELGRTRVALTGLLDGSSGRGAPEARRALRGAGYRTAERSVPAGPRLELPADFDELLGGVSRNLRQHFRRRRRQLQALGPLRLRTADADSAPADLDRFLRLEAAGWKGRAGTATLSSAAKCERYRRFFLAACREGLLRLQTLELGDKAVAVNVGCVFAGGAFGMKTAYDERFRGFSPGLVLLGETLRSAIADGLRFYDMMGAPEPYKVQWGPARTFVSIRAYRGPAAAALVGYQDRVRPALKRVRDAARVIG